MFTKKFLQARRGLTVLYASILISITGVAAWAYQFETTNNELSFLFFAYFGMIAFITVIYFIVARVTKQYEDALLKQATYDGLTGLPNRNTLHEELQKRIAVAKKEESTVAVFFIDLDDFKQINDTYNHFVGDQVLIEVAKRFQRSLRKDDFVARLGGDEFVVVASNHENARRKTVDIDKIAQQLHTSTTNAINFEDLTLYSNSSVGVATYPDISKTSTGLLRKADLAMYAAKKKGKNQTVLYTPSVERASLYEFELRNALRNALANNEFSLLYQPKWEAEYNQISGFEALIRWNNPAFSHIGPGDFIPRMEKLQIINRLGAFVLETACRDFAEYKTKTQSSMADYMPTMRVAINMSPLEFKNAKLLEDIKLNLAKYNLSPTDLEIEITEHILIDDHNEHDVVHDLSELGVAISIDDFGTGYSSLAKLNSLPINNIKIDKSFIDQIGKRKRGEKLVLTVLTLGEVLETTVIAEGVETIEQYKFLQRHDPSIIIQGYLYSKPLTLQELIDFQPPII